MSKFLGKAFTSMNQIFNDAASLKQSIAPEIAEAGAIASSYYYANVNAGIKIDDKNKFIAKQKNQILNGGPLAKQNAENATKFLNEQTAKQTAYNLKKKEYDQFVEFYDRKVEEHLKTSLMKYSDRVKFLERASDIRKAPAILKSIGANKDPEYKKFKSFSQDNIISKIWILNLMKSEEDNAKINLKSYKTSSNPMLVVDGWDKQKSKQTAYGVAKAVDSFGEPIASKTESISNKAKLNKSEQIVLNQKNSAAPVTSTTIDINDRTNDYIKNGYTMIPTPKGSNATIFHSGDRVEAFVKINNDLYLLDGDKSTGKYEVTEFLDNGDTGSTTVSDQEQINKIFGPALGAVNERLAAGVSTNEAVKVEETAKAEENGTKMPAPETTTTTPEATTTTSESQKTATESATTGKTSNYSGQTGYAPGQAKSSPTAKAFFRVKNPNGGPDKLYDAVTNKLIADEAEFKTGYNKEIEMPKTVKAIYRDGSKIYDYHTGKHITDPAILGSQYKGAIEVAKQKTDDDYFNEMKAEIGGERADGQPGYNDDQIKEIAKRYKEGKYGSAREAYADILSKQGKTEIETEERAKRKFSKILKNDDGTIKVDENGRPMKEDFFFPIYTSEELEKLSDEERARAEKEAKEAYLAKGGKEETWNSSQEKAALNDTLTNPASKDEMFRAADLKARDNMEKAKNPGKETTYRNPYGKSDYNVSEDTLVGSEDKKENTVLPTKGEDPTDPSGTTGGSTTNAGTAINPWAANSNKEKELAKFQYTSLEKKATSYKKFDNKNKLAGTE